MINSEIEVEPEFPVEPTSTIPEYLMGMRSSVATDGSGTLFDLAFTNQKPFRLLVPFNGMPAIFSEIRHAQVLMIQRQRMHLDRGAEQMLELCETALRPSHLDVLVDPHNGDRLFIHQFEHHAPVAFRVSPVDVMANLAIINLVLSRATN